MNEIELAKKPSPLDSALAASKPKLFERMIDGIIEPFSPETVQRRMRSRQELGYRRAMLSYAATVRTYERGYVVEPLTSEEAELPGYTRFQMILEARDLYRNSSIIRGGVNGIARRAIGTGIHPHFHTDDPEWNSEAFEQWNDWTRICDIRRNFDIHGMLRQAIRSAFCDGDLGFLLCDEEDDLRLQMIEADLIAQDYRIGINVDTYNPIGGVVIDQNNGRPLGYYVGRRGVGGLLIDSNIVPAEAFILMYRHQRVDQVRGVPLLAPVINTAKDLERYINATRVQANIAATYGVVVKRDMAAQIAMAQSQIPTGLTGNQNDLVSQNYRTMPLKTGLMTFLNPGESIETFKPDVPGPQFDPFAKFLVRMIAIGMGTTYEYLMQDYSGMSFSSSKTNLMDTTLTLKEWQRWAIDKFLSRVYPIWVAKRMNSGRLPFNDQAYTHLTWNRPADLGVDPQRDSAANVQLLSAGLETFQNLMQENGVYDWKNQLTQKANEAAFIKELAEARGISPELISSTLPPGVVSPGEKQKSEESKKQGIRTPRPEQSKV